MLNIPIAINNKVFFLNNKYLIAIGQNKIKIILLKIE